MGIKRFLLFTATNGERKQYVASFDSREAGVAVAGKLNSDGRMRWELVDSDSGKVVAEHRASELPAAPT